MPRDMTGAEREWLRSLSENSDPKPPWTAAKREARQARNEYICDLYEQGIPVRDIAAGAGLTTYAIVAVVRKARSEGRRVVRPRAMASDRPAFRRSLSASEVSGLLGLDGLVPRSRTGRRFMYGAPGQALLAEVKRLRDDRVALQTIADVLGVTRQSIHSMTHNVTEPLTAGDSQVG